MASEPKFEPFQPAHALAIQTHGDFITLREDQTMEIIDVVRRGLALWAEAESNEEADVEEARAFMIRACHVLGFLGECVDDSQIDMAQQRHKAAVAAQAKKEASTPTT